MSTTDKAKDIRDTLKRQYGWTGKQVSVRAKYFSLGSSIDIVIKDPAVWIKKVEAIAEPKEVIHRDGFGEILGGGNTYLHVNYDHGVLEVRGAKYLAAVKAAEGKLEPGTNSLIEIEGTTYLLGRHEHGNLTLWGDGHLGRFYGAEGVANHIATLVE